MTFSTTKMSSKGQVIIPGELRKRLNLKEGARFVVLGDRDTIVLKRVAPPSFDDIKDLLDDAADQAKRAKLTKGDLKKAITAVRKGK